MKYSIFLPILTDLVTFDDMDVKSDMRLWVDFQFVDEKVQWLHIDMAGPVWNDKKKTATGFAISTLVEWVLSNSSS